jgi:CheY-like chemotaxis protein
VKILLIESDSTFAQDLAGAIEARGLEARITGDGKEAVDLARADRPDLIVLCVELPKMSGYSVCNKLKKDDELKTIPLVIISAEATAETFEQHKKLKTRAEGYLIKPFVPAELLEVIGGILPLPPAEVVSTEEIVTLEGEQASDHEIEVEPEAPARPSEDDDMKLLDEAFDNLSGGPAPAAAPPTREPAPSRPKLASPPPPAELPAAHSDIDKLEEEADAALAALGEDEDPETDFAGVAASLDEPEPVVAPPPAPTPAPRRSATPAVADLTARLKPRESETPKHTPLPISDASRRAIEEQVAAAEAAQRAASALRTLQDEARAAAGRAQSAEARADSAEAKAKAEADRADREEQARHDADAQAAAAAERAQEAEERAHAAEMRAQEAEAAARAAEAHVHTAEQQAQAAEQQAQSAEQESMSLRLRLEEAEQTASQKASEAEQSRQRIESLEEELDAAVARAAARADELAGVQAEMAALRAEMDGLRGELSSARAEVDGSRAEAEQKLSDLRKRITDVEALNAKHEERVVKAYQKIKGDEKIREKTRKALGIALQLLEERAPGAAPAEVVQARRE